MFSKSSSDKSIGKSRSDAASVPLTPKFNKEESKDSHWAAPASVAKQDVLLSSLEIQNLERSRASSILLVKEE